MHTPTVGSSLSCVFLAALATACSGGDASTSGETGVVPEDTGPEVKVTEGLCGDEVFTDLEFTGIVLGTDDMFASGANVELQAFTFEPPRVLGSGSSNDEGEYTFSVTDLLSYTGDCWANGVIDYRLVGRLGGASGEVRVNQSIFNAIYQEGDKVVDPPSLRLSE